MPQNKKGLRELRRSIKSRLNKLISEFAGDKFLTEEEKSDLREKPSVESFIEQAFFLGRLQAVVKKKEYSSLSLEKLQEYKKDTSLSPEDLAALEQIQANAGAYIKELASHIDRTVFTALYGSDSEELGVAVVRDVLRHELADAIRDKKHYADVAAKLSSKLKEVHGKDWKLIARTELHQAKQRGVASMIKSGKGIYSVGGGPGAKVSVLTDTGRCKDCARLYETQDGSPKIFTLSELESNGTNAFRNHSKQGGIHIHWVPVIPPSHPRCWCKLVFVPPGYEWRGRKLVKVSNDLQKAIESGSIKGGSSGIPVWYLSKEDHPQRPANGVVRETDKSWVMQAGVQVVDPDGAVFDENSTKGSESKSGSTGTEAKDSGTRKLSPKEQADPFVAASSIPDGATRALSKPENESSGETRPLPRRRKADYDYVSDDSGYGRVGDTKIGDRFVGEIQDLPNERYNREAKEWSAKNANNVEILRDHVYNGKLVPDSVVPLGGGVTQSFVANIEGNGQVVLKPDPVGILATGSNTIPAMGGAFREGAAYRFASFLGFEDLVPVTATRNNLRLSGTDISSTGELEEKRVSSHFFSVQHKLDNADSFTTLMEKNGYPEGMSYLDVVERKHPEQYEKIKEKAAVATIYQMLVNSNDFHGGNLLVNEDFSDFRLIDNSCAFATGFQDHKNVLLSAFRQSGEPLVIPDIMLDKLINLDYDSLEAELTDAGIEPWAVAQTYLRAKYLVYLQEKEGSLDYDKFLSTVGGLPQQSSWEYSHLGEDNISEVAELEFISRVASKTTPNDLFNSFARKWIEERLNDPSHPEHDVASKLWSISPLVRPGTHLTDTQERFHDRSLRVSYFMNEVESKDPVEAFPMGSKAIDKYSRDPEELKEKIKDAPGAKEALYYLNNRGRWQYSWDRFEPPY